QPAHSKRRTPRRSISITNRPSSSRSRATTRYSATPSIHVQSRSDPTRPPWLSAHQEKTPSNSGWRVGSPCPSREGRRQLPTTPGAQSASRPQPGGSERSEESGRRRAPGYTLPPSARRSTGRNAAFTSVKSPFSRRAATRSCRAIARSPHTPTGRLSRSSRAQTILVEETRVRPHNAPDHDGLKHQSSCTYGGSSMSKRVLLTVLI